MKTEGMPLPLNDPDGENTLNSMDIERINQTGGLHVDVKDFNTPTLFRKWTQNPGQLPVNKVDKGSLLEN